MSLETDLILDRQRLKRHLFFWRTFAVIAVVAAVLIALHRGGVGFGRAHVARLQVNGLITEDQKLTRAVEKLADDDNVKALIVSIDSPGGSVAGGESLHDAIADVAAKKPVVTVMGGLAASAGYMIAVPAARIFAHEATLTGSIGVLLEIAGVLRAAGQDRRGRPDHRVRTAEGPAQSHPPDLTAGARGAAGAGDGHVRPVRRHGRGGPPHGPGQGPRNSATGAPIPAARPCSSA